MKIVFDTNVILSAFLTEGLSHKVFENCLSAHDVIISEWIIGELKKVLKNKFHVPQLQINRVTGFLRKNLMLIEPKGSKPAICRDKDDNNILHLAEYSKAHYIITGDNDLLDLKSFKKCKIINPRKFIEITI